MILTLTLLGLSFASTGLIVFELQNAPEGFEDQSGFHLVRKDPTRRETAAHKGIRTSPAGKPAAKNQLRSLTSPA